MLAVLITPFLLALLFSLILEPPIALLTRLYGSRKLAALLVFLSLDRKSTRLNSSHE